jgi:hypothetical protein
VTKTSELQTGVRPVNHPQNGPDNLECWSSLLSHKTGVAIVSSRYPRDIYSSNRGSYCFGYTISTGSLLETPTGVVQ